MKTADTVDADLLEFVQIFDPTLKVLPTPVDCDAEGKEWLKQIKTLYAKKLLEVRKSAYRECAEIVKPNKSPGSSARAFVNDVMLENYKAILAAEAALK